MNPDSPDIPQKQCSVCKEFFPASAQFFGKHKSAKSGLYSSCKSCRRQQRQKYNGGYYLEYHRKYYQQNKERFKEQNKIYRLEHKEQSHAMHKRWREAHEEELIIKNQVYRDTHRKELREYDKQYRRTEHRRTLRQAYSHRRMALKQSAEGTLTAKEITEKLKAQKYRCYYCNEKFERVREDNTWRYIYQLEHTIPLSRTQHNPRHDKNYVVLACQHCNYRKHDKLPHEWPEGGRLL